MTTDKLMQVTILNYRLVSNESDSLSLIPKVPRSCNIKEVHQQLLLKNHVLCLANIVSLGCIIGNICIIYYYYVKQY